MKSAGVHLKQYKPGLLDLWSKNGGIYGLPKDFDTIALAYDSTFTPQHGVTDARMAKLTWNPKNGHLRVDAEEAHCRSERQQRALAEVRQVPGRDLRPCRS